MNSQDWRLQNQESYMLGLTLTKKSYAPSNPTNDHDHCEFCSIKFMQSLKEDVLNVGYTTPDGYRWVCEQCYNDFKKKFKWQ